MTGPRDGCHPSEGLDGGCGDTLTHCYRVSAPPPGGWGPPKHPRPQLRSGRAGQKHAGDLLSLKKKKKKRRQNKRCFCRSPAPLHTFLGGTCFGSAWHGGLCECKLHAGTLSRAAVHGATFAQLFLMLGGFCAHQHLCCTVVPGAHRSFCIHQSFSCTNTWPSCCTQSFAPAPHCTLIRVHPLAHHVAHTPLQTSPHASTALGSDPGTSLHTSSLIACLQHRRLCMPAPCCTGVLHTVKLLHAGPCTPVPCTPVPCCTLPVCKPPASCCMGVPAHSCLLHGGTCTPGPLHSHSHCRGRSMQTVTDLCTPATITGYDPGILLINVRCDGSFPIPL